MPPLPPTPAPSASPPPRGEGLGVGGLALAFTLALTPASAQVIPTGSPAADILLSQAIAEHRIFLTCSALDPDTHALIARHWQDDTASAAKILADHGTPPEAIAAFTAAADPAALLPAEDTPFAEVARFCTTHADWTATYSRLNFVILDLKLPKALAP